MPSLTTWTAFLFSRQERSPAGSAGDRASRWQQRIGGGAMIVLGLGLLAGTVRGGK
jgi:hypothetical protein